MLCVHACQWLISQNIFYRNRKKSSKTKEQRFLSWLRKHKRISVTLSRAVLLMCHIREFSYTPPRGFGLSSLNFTCSGCLRLILLCFSLNHSIKHTCFTALLLASVKCVMGLVLAAVVHLNRVCCGYCSLWILTSIHCYFQSLACLNCFYSWTGNIDLFFCVYTNCIQALDGKPAAVFYQLYHSN